MPINSKNTFGQIHISDNAISSLVGSNICESYGIVGVVSKNFVKDKYNDLLKKENYAKGIIISNKKNELFIDAYVILSYGVKISEVILEAQKRVKYIVEKTLNLDIKEINIHVEGIKEI